MQNNDQMHPQDMRNLIVFALLAILMWVGYDHFIARPQAEAVREYVAKANEAAKNAPSQILETAIVKPRPEAIADTPRAALDSKTMNGSVNLKGGRLDDVELKDYFKTVERKEEVTTLSPARSPFPRYVETGWIGKDVAGLPNADTQWSIKGNDKLTPGAPLTLTYNAGGLSYEKIFTIDDESGFSIEDRVTNNSGAKVTLYPYSLVTEHGQPEDFLGRGVVHEGPIGYIGEDLHELSYKAFKKKPEQSFDGATGWIGLTGKYWLTAIVPPQGEEAKYRFIMSPAINDKTKDRYQSDITGAGRDIAAGETISYKINVFSGAKKLKALEDYEEKWNIPHFDLAVDFGWFYFLTKPFFLAINFLYGLTGNFGIAIILFTCCLRVFVFPLANTSYRSFAKLRMVSPEMYNLRHEYKDDKQKLQEELVKLYQKHNVNPMAGCLPIVVQIPIFFALYKVLSNTIEMRHAPFIGWIHDLSAKDPTSVFNLFGLLPFDAPTFLMIGAWPCMMLMAQLAQKSLSPPPDDPIQARLIAIMPWVTTYIMSGFASGLVIYWTVNSTLGVIQQMIIMKSMNVPIHLFSKDKMKAKLEKEIEEGPIVEPSLQILEEKLEDAITPDGEPKLLSKPKPKKKKKK